MIGTLRTIWVIEILPATGFVKASCVRNLTWKTGRGSSGAKSDKHSAKAAALTWQRASAFSPIELRRLCTGKSAAKSAYISI